jgi:hypothetical protein
MKHTSIALDKLELWFKIAKPGDIAFHFDIDPERYWIYIYREEDTAPCWHVFNDVASAQKYLDSSLEPNMEKRCENCKHFKNIPGSFSWCSHKEHAGTLVPIFTACADHEPKQLTGPFDNLKFFIKDQKTGELTVKYICDDCSKVMDEPFRWWYALPIKLDTGNSRSPGYHFRCEECDNKKKAIEGR